MRILIIDDHPEVREIVRHQLEDLGHSVTDRPSGNSAITLLRSDSSFDFIVSDFQMPDGNGFDVLNFLSATKSNIRIALFTSYEGLERSVDYENLVGIFSKSEFFKVLETIKNIPEI